MFEESGDPTEDDCSNSVCEGEEEGLGEASKKEATACFFVIGRRQGRSIKLTVSMIRTAPPKMLMKETKVEAAEVSVVANVCRRDQVVERMFMSVWREMTALNVCWVFMLFPSVSEPMCLLNVRAYNPHSESPSFPVYDEAMTA